MNTPAQDFLTQEQREQINRKVHEVEQQTSGEIVPMIVSSSYHYPMATLIGALLLACCLSLIANMPLCRLLELPDNNLLVFFALFLPSFPLFYWLTRRFPFLKSCFVFPPQMDEEVKEGAITAFFTEELYKTREENGVLIYLSLFEKRAWILGDKGVNAKIEQQEWQHIISLLTLGIKKGDRGEAICKAVEQVGEILKMHFPAQPDDVDELHDLIIR